MPTTPTYPGVYIEEMPSHVRTLVGVPTSITAFVGRTLRGPENEPVRIASQADFERRFGGLWAKSPVSYAVAAYYLNGGSDALIVRVTADAVAAKLDLAATGTDITELIADSPGAWGNGLAVAIDHQTADPADTTQFNLFIRELDPSSGAVLAAETHRNLSNDPDAPRYSVQVLEQESTLISIQGTDPTRPAASELLDGEIVYTALTGGTDGAPVTADEVATGVGMSAGHRGIYALDTADLFNLLVIPPMDPDAEDEVGMAAVVEAARAYCLARRAMLLLDPPPSWQSVEDVEAAATAGNIPRDPNTVLYYPRVRMSDPLRENRLGTFAPSGVMAGVIARTDATRGVWKAPAGNDAALVGVPELAYTMTDAENGRINPLGVNALRTFAVIGRVAWGARTTHGADALASQWKYLPVRRLALYLEESLYRGTKWAVFEPNDEPLWSQLRLNITGFMQDLFRKGAFQGSSPKTAYLVKCDAETTTQGDIDRGIVNVIVGFAPLKPAEFVIIKITQLAGQDQG